MSGPQKVIEEKADQLAEKQLSLREIKTWRDAKQIEDHLKTHGELELKGGPTMPQVEGQVRLKTFCAGDIVSKSLDGTFKLDKVKEILESHRGLDLLVTPEYSFFPSRWRIQRGDPSTWPRVKLENGRLETVVDNAASRNLISAVDGMRELAKEYQTNIVLGTIPLSITLPHEGREIEVVSNAILLIEKDGNIAASRIKTTGSDHANFPHYENDTKQIRDAFNEWAVKQADLFVMHTREGKRLTAYSFICADCGDNAILAKFKDKPADLYIYSGVNGDDAGAGWLTFNIQKGLASFENYITKSIRENGLLEQNKGVVLSSHPDQAGRFNGTGAYYLFSDLFSYHQGSDLPSRLGEKENAYSNCSYAADHLAVSSLGGVYAEFRIPPSPVEPPESIRWRRKLPSIQH